MFKQIQYACASHIGKVRSNNEDNFYLHGIYMPSNNVGTVKTVYKRFLAINREKGAYFAVFDGMGGGDYGEVASYRCAESTERFLSDESNINVYDVTPTLQHLCQTVNNDVNKDKQKLGVEQMGSTLVSVFLNAGFAWVCNLGDSRCYWFKSKDDSLEMVSIDHIETVGVTGKHVVTQYLGIDYDLSCMKPHIKCFEPVRNDKILLCSDGLTDYVAEEQICKVLQCGAPNENVDSLLNEALNQGGKDNTTIVVIKCI